jgi:hypothetical protein
MAQSGPCPHKKHLECKISTENVKPIQLKQRMSPEGKGSEVLTKNLLHNMLRLDM